MSNRYHNKWNVGDSAILFFENMLSSHNAVASFTRSNDIQFQIRRKDGLSDVNAVLVDVYAFGEAHVYGLLHEFHGVTAIVNGGGWNLIALDRKTIANRTRVTVFSMGDFMGALNVDRLEEYTPRDEREARRRKRRKSS